MYDPFSSHLIVSDLNGFHTTWLSDKWRWVVGFYHVIAQCTLLFINSIITSHFVHYYWRGFNENVHWCVPYRTKFNSRVFYTTLCHFYENGSKSCVINDSMPLFVRVAHSRMLRTIMCHFSSEWLKVVCWAWFWAFEKVSII